MIEFGKPNLTPGGKKGPTKKGLLKANGDAAVLRSLQKRIQERKQAEKDRLRSRGFIDHKELRLTY